MVIYGLRFIDFAQLHIGFPCISLFYDAPNILLTRF